MIEQVKVHFDELLLAVLFLICLAVWIHHPDAKEWAGGCLAALIMALKNKQGVEKGETRTDTKTVLNTTTGEKTQ